MYKNIIFVAIGGALGSVLRYTISLTENYFKIHNFPYSTLLINFIGSFFIGFLTSYFIKETSFPQAYKLLLITGFCGGFTTFSTFSLENIKLIQNGELGIAIIYIISSVLLGLLSVWIGLNIK